MKANLTRLLLIAVWFTLPAWSYAKEDVPLTLSGATVVSAEDLIDLAAEFETLVIIDSRKPSDREMGFIEGSVGLVNTDTNAQTLAEHLTDKDIPVVFYCNGVKCARSMHAAEFAINQGYSKVYWYRAGWQEWIENGFPVSMDVRCSTGV